MSAVHLAEKLMYDNKSQRTRTQNHCGAMDRINYKHWKMLAYFIAMLRLK